MWWRNLNNLILVLKDQMPLSRLWRNVWRGHLIGLFSQRSHLTHKGKPKVKYNTKASAQKAATTMSKKTGWYFSNYKCPHCTGYHVGKNSNMAKYVEPTDK